MTIEQEKAKSYFDGAFMAWDDCATMAQYLSENSHQMPSGLEFSPREMALIRAQTKAVFETFAEAIRAKAQHARDMLKAAEAGLQ